MEFKLTFRSRELSREDIRRLLQSIRDCEMGSFPDKKISIWIEVPELSAAECKETLASIKPPYSGDVFTFTRRQ